MNLLSKTLSALADATRRAIIGLLQDGDLTAGEIAAHFAISAPSISHHLNVLKNAELICVERRGQTLVYSLNTTVIQEFLNELMNALHIDNNTESEESNA